METSLGEGDYDLFLGTSHIKIPISIPWNQFVKRIFSKESLEFLLSKLSKDEI